MIPPLWLALVRPLPIGRAAWWLGAALVMGAVVWEVCE